MKVRVTIVETKTTHRTYEVNRVNDLETAKKCAHRCATQQFQPNTYLYQTVPHPPTYRIDTCEVVEP